MLNFGQIKLQVFNNQILESFVILSTTCIIVVSIEFFVVFLNNLIHIEWPTQDIRTVIAAELRLFSLQAAWGLLSLLFFILII